MTTFGPATLPDVAQSVVDTSPRRPLVQWLCARPQSRHEAAARISAHVYGNLTTLGAMLALAPGSAVSSSGAYVVIAACLSTFLAHAFSDLLSRRVGYDHQSMFTAATATARNSMPILTAAALPLAMLTVGGWAQWSEPLTQLTAELFICVRIGMIGALTERFRGHASSRRLVMLGVCIAVGAGFISIAKLVVT